MLHHTPPEVSSSSGLPSTVAGYYTRKTKAILHKYGPGPRVHFHVGMVTDQGELDTSVAQSVLKQRIVASQEAVLDHAVDTWGLAAAPPARLLDIGCGLGGGSLYWAQEHRTTVTGLTIVPEHIPLIGQFARAAGVHERVGARLADIHDLDEHQAYDAAFASESSGYMDRTRLFDIVSRALVPGGWFGLQEHFIRRPQWSEFIDGYYKTRLGTLPEYLTAAEAAGFSLEQNEDITDHVAQFWVQSRAWTTEELHAIEHLGRPSPIPTDRLRESALTHGTLFRIWREHALETRLLLFRLKG